MSMMRSNLTVRDVLETLLAADPSLPVTFALFQDESYAIGNVEITEEGVVLA